MVIINIIENSLVEEEHKEWSTESNKAVENDQDTNAKPLIFKGFSLFCRNQDLYSFTDEKKNLNTFLNLYSSTSSK